MIFDCARKFSVVGWRRRVGEEGVENDGSTAVFFQVPEELGVKRPIPNRAVSLLEIVI